MSRKISRTKSCRKETDKSPKEKSGPEPARTETEERAEAEEATIRDETPEVGDSDLMVEEKLVSGDGAVHRSGYQPEESVLYTCKNTHGGPEQIYSMEQHILRIIEYCSR